MLEVIFVLYYVGPPVLVIGFFIWLFARGHSEDMRRKENLERELAEIQRQRDEDWRRYQEEQKKPKAPWLR